MVSGIVIKGDVLPLKRFLTPSVTAKNLEAEVRKATLDNAMFLVSKVKEQIRNRRFTASSPLTLALSRGQIPLLKEKNLFDAIGFILKSSFEAEVGITQGKLTTGGVRSRPFKMEKVVLLLHDGFTIDVTPEMRAAIAASLRQRKGRGSKASSKTLEEGKGKTTYRVPPRRFLTTIFKNHAVEERVRRRWREAVETAFLKSGAKGGDHKDR